MFKSNESTPLLVEITQARLKCTALIVGVGIKGISCHLKITAAMIIRRFYS